MHVQDLDERSTCHTFVICLNAVRDWSKQHPHALPLFILVETKEGVPSEMPNAPLEMYLRLQFLMHSMQRFVLSSSPAR